MYIKILLILLRRNWATEKLGNLLNWRQQTLPVYNGLFLINMISLGVNVELFQNSNSQPELFLSSSRVFLPLLLSKKVCKFIGKIANTSDFGVALTSAPIVTTDEKPRAPVTHILFSQHRLSAMVLKEPVYASTDSDILTHFSF